MPSNNLSNPSNPSNHSTSVIKPLEVPSLFRLQASSRPVSLRAAREVCSDTVSIWEASVQTQRETWVTQTIERSYFVRCCALGVHPQVSVVLVVVATRPKPESVSSYLSPFFSFRSDSLQAPSTALALGPICWVRCIVDGHGLLYSYATAAKEQRGRSTDMLTLPPPGGGLDEEV